MRSALSPRAWLPLLAAGVLAWAQGAGAQGFSADYELARPGAVAAEPETPGRTGMFNLGPVRINPAFHADPGFSGAGLSLDAGRHWFAQIGFGRSVSTDVLNIGGGYRWNDGRSLSLQLNRGRSTERLGLSVSYDWPRYFVRLTYDSKLAPIPQDSLRFSAGVRF